MTREGAPPPARTFDADADAYDRYLDSPRGRLRQEAALANLLESIRGLRDGTSLRVLDAGGGTGRLATELARRGHRVRLLDPSSRMLELARRRASAAGPGVEQRLACTVGTVEAFARTEPGEYDVAVAHNVLEYVPDPGAAVSALAALLRPGGHASVMCANRLAQPVSAALRGADPATVGAAMERRTFPTDLFGGRRDEYSPGELAGFADRAGLRVLRLLGVSVFATLAPDAWFEGEDAGRLRVEMAAGREPAYLGVARYVQCIARKER